MKKSINIKGVPHTSITLHSKISGGNGSELIRQNSLNTTLHSRKSSFTMNENSLRVITIGTEC